MEVNHRSLARRSVFSVFCVSIMVGCTAGSLPPAVQSTAPSSGSGSAGVKVSVYPDVIGLTRGETYNFQSIVSGNSNTTVTWSIQENPAGGVISTSGVYGFYTSPATTGVYHVVATSQADPTQSAVATVNVTASGFSPTGDLKTARLQHTATLLPNGKVLIAGGGYGPDIIDGYWVADQAELFDPTTGVFSPAGQITRDGHTATLLRNGDVLLAGGEIAFPIVSNTADLRIAATGAVQPTGSMALGREAHTATLLNDGRVLITGGVILTGTFWEAVRDSEIYDPASGTFTPTGKMNIARALHTATLLPDGKVLVAGGAYPDVSGVGGVTAELFDPSTSTFTLTDSMSVPRSSGTATLLPSGKILMTGRSTEADLYDPPTGTFRRTGDMSVSRTNHTATLLEDGTVLIAGGPSATTEIYTPATGTFLPGVTMHQERFSHTATLLPDGRVVIIGGATFTDIVHINVLSSAEIYQ